MRAAMPDRSDGVDHMPRGQAKASGDLGITGRAAAKRLARSQQFRPRRAMDRPVNAAPAQKRGIGSVDDSVNAERGDVGNNDFQLRAANPARQHDQAAEAPTAMPLSAKSCCSSPAWNISRTMSQPPTNSPLT